MERKLSDTNFVIKIDTPRDQFIQKNFSNGVITKINAAGKKDNANATLNIWLSNRHSQSSTPISTSVSLYNFYKNRLGKMATSPQVLTEMAFYTPPVASYIISILSIGDIPVFPPRSNTLAKGPNLTPLPYDSVFKNATFSMPPNYRRAAPQKSVNIILPSLKKCISTALLN